MVDKSPAERYFEYVQAELNRERAAVLGRYGRRVEEAITRCRAELDRLDPDDPHSLEAYRSSRRAVLGAIEDLCLQREVLGLTDHSWVDRIYGVPPRH